MKYLCGFLLTLILTAFSLAQSPPSAPISSLNAGDTAPDFELTDTAGQKIKLSDFKGKKTVVLAFYILAFTGG